jgi:hypothetical protein
MDDYEQVTQHIREGLSKIAANTGNKSVEIIGNEILMVLTTPFEQHEIDKFEFIRVCYEWHKGSGTPRGWTATAPGIEASLLSNTWH